ncbi:hypothetical protein KM043_005047 [Ampulex compressa]|nr:hypothetical protein KM043_005047 [Ampulex compressa]
MKTRLRTSSEPLEALACAATEETASLSRMDRPTPRIGVFSLHVLPSFTAHRSLILTGACVECSSTLSLPVSIAIDDLYFRETGAENMFDVEKPASSAARH